MGYRIENITSDVQEVSLTDEGLVFTWGPLEVRSILDDGIAQKCLTNNTNLKNVVSDKIQEIDMLRS